VSQALAFGVPVVTTRHCDIPWIVAHERMGFIVESGDVERAATHLARLIEQPAVCRALGRSGREFARRHLSPTECGQALERGYADAVALGPVTSSARDERLHPELLAGIVLNLRLRAGDVDGLVRLRASPRLGRDLHYRAHQAIGQVYEQRGDAARAARAFQRLRRLTPNDPYAGLQEARAWLRSDTPGRAIAPLAAFVTTHADLSYALTVAMAELDAHPDGPALARLLTVRARTPAARLGFELLLLERGAGVEAAATNRRRLRQVLARFRRSRGSADGAFASAQIEAALVAAYIFALRLEDAASASALRWLREPGRVRQPLVRYRMASALAARGGTSTDWARRVFLHLGRSRDLPSDARAGAWFHLAEIGRRMGMTRQACRALDRCLAIVPDHDAAIHLRETLRNCPRESA
jgi:tetratricopeptide (TPR) repeat protein